MKRIFIILLIIFIISMYLIIKLVCDADASQTKELNQIENKFSKKIKLIKINDIYFYYGNKTYVIVNYQQNNDTNIYSSLDTNGNILDSIYSKNLYALNKITKKYSNIKTSILGYKNNKFIYEITQNINDNYIYNYYDAVDGKFIKKIIIKK